MTLPDERYRAVMAAKELLIDLTDPKATPKIPRELRLRAGHCLRHFPSKWDMDIAALDAPTVFQEKMEPLYRMVKKYEQDKTNTD